jgi:hypothetical protein
VDSLSTDAGPAAPANSTANPLSESVARLALRLQHSLAPVEPRPVFVAELQGRLVVEHAAAAAARASTRAKEKEQRLRWVAGLGGALYLASLGFVSFRAAQAVTGRVAALAAARGGQGALPEASIAT